MSFYQQIFSCDSLLAVVIETFGWSFYETFSGLEVLRVLQAVSFQNRRLPDLLIRVSLHFGQLESTKSTEQ